MGPKGTVLKAHCGCYIEKQGQAALYNRRNMEFLDAQLEKLRGLERPTTVKAKELDRYNSLLEKGERLLAKHADHFDVKDFYTTQDACSVVEEICACLHEITEHWEMASAVCIEYTVPRDLVEEDEDLLNNLLNFILRDVQCNIGPELLHHWEAIKARHKENVKQLQITAEDEVQMGAQLGAGGQGVVYKALWHNAPVAVKRPTRDRGNLPIAEFASFFKEVIAHAILSHHPNIAQLFAATVSGWIVLELADADLHMLCHGSKRLAWRLKVRLLQQAAAGLAYIHSQGQLHGDIKPRNFLVFGTHPENFRLKVTDFGLSSEVVQSRSKTGRLGGGTPKWMAPELYDGKPIDQKSDVYSFGVVCHEVVSQKHPFGADNTNEMAIMAKKLWGEEPCKIEPQDCPPQMVQLMRRCCAFHPSERPTMEEVSNFLLQLPEEWSAEDPKLPSHTLDTATEESSAGSTVLSRRFEPGLSSATTMESTAALMPTLMPVGGSIRTYPIGEQSIASPIGRNTADSADSTRVPMPTIAPVGHWNQPHLVPVTVEKLPEHLQGLKYNQNVIHFLKQQLAKVPESEKERPSCAMLISKGKRLIGKHEKEFCPLTFYETRHLVDSVEQICKALHEDAEDWAVDVWAEFPCEVPKGIITKDQERLDTLIAYIFLNADCHFEDVHVQEEWTGIRRELEGYIKCLQPISDDSIICGKKIGEGIHGNVYKAHWKNHCVAVKIRTKENAELLMESVAAFFKEVSLHHSLRDPHVVEWYATTKSGWLVMELADADLKSLLKRHPAGLPWRLRLNYARQAGAAVKYLHDRDTPVMHSDIKSTNFLVFGNEPDNIIIKIADFGLSAAFGKTKAKTAVKSMGTLEWQPPEIYDDEPHTLASDVFSLGVVLYEIVTGKHPYGVENMTLDKAQAVVLKQKMLGKEPANVKPVDCPEAMHLLMKQCCAKEPGDRPTMKAVCSELEQVSDEWAPPLNHDILTRRTKHSR